MKFKIYFTEKIEKYTIIEADDQETAESLINSGDYPTNTTQEISTETLTIDEIIKL